MEEEMKHGSRSKKNSKYSWGASLAQALGWPIDWFFWRLNMFWRIITRTIQSQALAQRSIYTVVVMVLITIALLYWRVVLEPSELFFVWALGVAVRWFGQGHENNFISTAYHFVLSVLMAFILSTLILIYIMFK